MKLFIKTVRFKNFLSTGNDWTEINLAEYKTTLIVGKNGSGKSTLLDAIFFALFNRPFRKINKPQLVNSITGKDCVVEIEFELNGYEFKVVRGIKPALFEIWKDNDLITQAADNRDYQDAFEKYILKVTHKTFSQIVVLGSAIFVPFLALPTPQRREVYEDVLDLEVFTKMNELLKERLDAADFQIYEKENEKKLLDNTYSLTKETLDRVNTSKERMIEELEEKYIGYNKKLIEILQVIQDLELTIEKLDIDYKPKQDVDLKKTEIIQIKSELSQKSRSLAKDYLFFQNNEVCPTCHQDIDKEFKQKIIMENQTKADEINKAIAVLNGKLEGVEVVLRELDKIKEKRNNINDLVLQKKTEEVSIQEQRDDTNKTINNITNETTYEADFSKLEEIKTQLDDVEKYLASISDDRVIMGYAAVLLKDSGIKGKIIKNFIPVINQYIQKYLAALDFFVEFNLDEQFNETILSRHRDNFSYESFSEGEKMRLNLAILFTWRSIAKLRSSINCNLLVFDELLDSALDTEGIDDILRVIGNLTNDDNVVIISHREDQISDKFSKVLRFEKVKNFQR